MLPNREKYAVIMSSVIILDIAPIKILGLAASMSDSALGGLYVLAVAAPPFPKRWVPPNPLHAALPLSPQLLPWPSPLSLQLLTLPLSLQLLLLSPQCLPLPLSPQPLPFPLSPQPLTFPLSPQPPLLHDEPPHEEPPHDSSQPEPPLHPPDPDQSLPVLPQLLPLHAPGGGTTLPHFPPLTPLLRAGSGMWSYLAGIAALHSNHLPLIVLSK
mmetsp:Transcript_6079/g.14806  ORF Transcript_6079/g.14806 Transcript_6079/m.14806 type:complete len:213 (+) Transcript_6079:710-1348(+)